MENEKQEADALARERADQIVTNAYHRVAETEDGKLVIADLEAKFGLTKRVFTAVKAGDGVFSYDPLTAALTDGGRAVLIYIRDRLARPVKGDGNISEPTTQVIKP